MADANEIRALERRVGPFARATFEFRVESASFGEWLKRLTRRRGEVVLVVPRKSGCVLLHTKPHYPDEVYRLPTGGIHPAEPALDAARREAFEEIGFKTEHLQLLGVLDNLFSTNGTKLVYPSFVFQTERYLRKPKPMDPEEPISGFRQVDAEGLSAAALHLASLPAMWREWGKFRAASHFWLAERLKKR